MELTFTPIYNREVNEIDSFIYEKGLNGFKFENESEETYIFYSKYGNKTFYISNDKGIISDVICEDFKGDISFKPIFLNETERKIISFTLNNLIYYSSQPKNEKIYEVIDAIKINLEVLLSTKVLKNEFDPTTSKQILSMIK